VQFANVRAGEAVRDLPRDQGRTGGVTIFSTSAPQALTTKEARHAATWEKPRAREYLVSRTPSHSQFNGAHGGHIWKFISVLRAGAFKALKSRSRNRFPNTECLVALDGQLTQSVGCTPLSGATKRTVQGAKIEQPIPVLAQTTSAARLPVGAPMRARPGRHERRAQRHFDRLIRELKEDTAEPPRLRGIVYLDDQEKP
jgi:hypothetical protein